MPETRKGDTQSLTNTPALEIKRQWWSNTITTFIHTHTAFFLYLPREWESPGLTQIEEYKADNAWENWIVIHCLCLFQDRKLKLENSELWDFWYPLTLMLCFLEILTCKGFSFSQKKWGNVITFKTRSCWGYSPTRNVLSTGTAI